MTESATMSVYLHDIPLETAQAKLGEALADAGLGGTLGEETVPLDEAALGRVLSSPVWAQLSSPHYHAAAMDGFAVRSGDTDGASLTAPLALPVGERVVYVDTGDPLPAGTNAVIPIEDVEALDTSGQPDAHPRQPHQIRIRAAVPPWKHVRAMGEDMVATELLLPAGHTLRPVDLGAIAGCGHAQVLVARRPRVAIIPTGSELVEIGNPVGEGEIIEYNSLVMASQVAGWGGAPTRLPIVRDEVEEIKEAVGRAAQVHDLILLSAGSSAGSEDYSAQVVAALGELLVHGVAVRPGHPVILGMVHRESGGRVPIIGVPGYPVSAALTGEIFVEPLLARWLGRRSVEPATITATLTRKVVSPAGDDDFLRVAVGRVGARTLAAPLARGAGVVTSLVRADGLVLLPRGSQGQPAGAEVTVRLYRSPAEVARTIFAIGSHDMTLDLIAQHLAGQARRLASANVGSLGGLVALRRGEAHLAGSHLLDPESGEFNLAYIPQYLPGMAVMVIGLVGRQQGLLVPRGNPAGIRSLEDLAVRKVSFVNRQRGSGTRVLLDYHLDLMGIAPGQVRGYNQEEYTHLAVAAAVASGRAECGLAIAAAAQALNLDFVPLFQERYDLVIPREHYHSRLLEPLLGILEEREFARAVAALPGYDTSPMGKLIAELE